jgi:hypothetical protein
MNIDAGSFFILVGTLAAGGAAGYVASNKHLFEQPAPPAPAPSATASAPASVPPPTKPASPPCDDSVGTPGTCPPPVYSADETGCGPLPTKRCDDFKQTLKPKVAERAVACLNAIQPAQRCDPLRLNLCGHLALMSACQEAEDTDKEAADAAPLPASSLTTACQAILQECAAATIGPTLRDCRATLAGMTELGRQKMVDCMKAHCGDKGLLHCETVIDVK